MSLKIRMKRIGTTNRPFFRLVVQDTRWRRDGKTIADIGWYDPLKDPAQTSFKEEEVFYWMDQGALLSETARTLLKREGILARYKKGSHKSKSATPESPIQEIPPTGTEKVL